MTIVVWTFGFAQETIRELSVLRTTVTRPIITSIAAAKRENDILANKPLVSQFARDSIELNRRKNVTNRKKEEAKPSSSLPNKPSNGNINKKKVTTTKNKVCEKKAAAPADKKDPADEATTAVRAKAGGKGKENGDSNADTILAEGKILMRRKSSTKKKMTSDSYYMDFESLKREHADAISMLKQLDEENKRLFVKKEDAVDDSNACAATFGWAGGEDGSEELLGQDVDESIVPVSVPEGLLDATHLSIDIDNNDEEYDVDIKDEAEAQVGSDNDAIDNDDDDDDSERTSSYYNEDIVPYLDSHEEDN